MIRYLGSWLWYKISLNLVGAWYLIREQVWDRHQQLPPLVDQEVGLGCKVIFN